LTVPGSNALPGSATSPARAAPAAPTWAMRPSVTVMAVSRRQPSGVSTISGTSLIGGRRVYCRAMTPHHATPRPRAGFGAPAACEGVA